MGYRSEVAFVIEFNTPEQAQAYFQQGLKKYSELAEACTYGLSFEDDSKYIKFEVDWYKWYEDYPEVQQLTEFYRKSIDAEGFLGYAFCRIGEDINDVDEDYEGDNAYEYLHVSRCLVVNV